MEYQEVWNIEPLQLDIDYFSPTLIVGIVFILYESIIIFSRYKWGEDSTLFRTLNAFSRPQYPYSLIFFPIGIISIIIGIVIISNANNSFNELSNEIHNAERKTVEGEVIVEFEQPREGHTKGDIIHIGNKTFEISTFSGSSFYHEAISNGGYLTAGENVRITFIAAKESEKSDYGDGKIIKIELKK